jgi:pyruvate ferredoxin oxidoreductase alpha subunit
VFEKDVSYGYSGALATDIKGALDDVPIRPEFRSFVSGLGGRDVRPEQLLAAALGEAPEPEKTAGWINVRI